MPPTAFVRRSRIYGGAFVAAGILAFTAFPAVSVPMRPVDPDWGWFFDDGSGTTATSAHGAEDGTLHNGVSWSSDTPFAYDGNYSIRLDGSNDYVEMSGLDDALNGSTAFSLSLWIRSDSTSQDRAFWNGVSPSGSDSFGGTTTSEAG